MVFIPPLSSLLVTITTFVHSLLLLIVTVDIYAQNKATLMSSEDDKSEIQEYITSLETSTNPATGIYYKSLMLEFISELVKDRVNESRPNGILPIIEY